MHPAVTLVSFVLLNLPKRRVGAGVPEAKTPESGELPQIEGDSHHSTMSPDERLELANIEAKVTEALEDLVTRLGEEFPTSKARRQSDEDYFTQQGQQAVIDKLVEWIADR